MTDGRKYNGSYNPFDDPDEIVAEPAQDYTNLNLPQQQYHHMEKKDSNNDNSIKNTNNSNLNKKTSTNGNNNINGNSTNQNVKENSNFTQKAKSGVNNVLTFTSEKVGKPFISFGHKVNEKFTTWFNL
ncbi:hypothetical protein M9Y10_033509 [Tritrichomonas musculus]|uniref:Uncharacterized protein n=1 Tax=Tritrichomonas musculus TaxID=1915356 RepID=A0ABR2KFI2_9EUKA